MVKYLNVVQNPVSFKMILNNLNTYKYSCREDFMLEIFTMINNTNQYYDGNNKTTSDIKECDRIKSLVLEYDEQHSKDVSGNPDLNGTIDINYILKHIHLDKKAKNNLKSDVNNKILNSRNETSNKRKKIKTYI